MATTTSNAASDAPSYGQSAHYLDAAGERYFSWQNSTMDVGGRIEARKFARHIASTDTVLDFGCGGGFTLKNLHCARRLGVEINPAARRVAVTNGLECFADIAEVPNATADVVISNHALEHVPYPIQAMRELKRVLKPGGKLVVVLPIDDWRTQRRYKETDINHHLYTWTPQLLGNCLVEAGFPWSTFEVRVLQHAWIPGYHKIYGRVPDALFDAVCWLYSGAIKLRQVTAVATAEVPR